MKIININDKDFNIHFEEILARGKMDIDSVEDTVKGIINNIKIHKDKAIMDDIEKFDRWKPTAISDIIIDIKDMKNAYYNLDLKLKKALELAYVRIKKYHEKQVQKSWMSYEDSGEILGQKITPIESAGLYIPGGKAAYPSSLLMNAIPAIVAGVKNIVVCTPTPDNEINELLLAAMHICNIKKAYKIGGASAIGSMAYGTQTIPKVDVITGPGNIFVATAKKLVYGEVNIDMIAGPSEIGILADASARIDYLSMDLLSQAEHDEMASSILITTSNEIAIKTKEKIYEDIKTLSRRDIAQKSIETRGVIIVTNTMDEAISLMDKIAPEHLEVLTKNPFDLLPKINNAGAIFLGENTTEPIGDYIAGPNHTLPTGGTARFYSPLSVDNFIKKSSILCFSKESIKAVGEECALIAKTEGLDAHMNAVLLRLENS